MADLQRELDELGAFFEHAAVQQRDAERIENSCGLLGLIAERNGFEGIEGEAACFEYWSLAKYRDRFGRCVRPDKASGPDGFLDHARRNFQQVASDYLLGEKEFEAKLHPAYAPYADYDQLMRLEEWYGRK